MSMFQIINATGCFVDNLKACNGIWITCISFELHIDATSQHTISQLLLTRYHVSAWLVHQPASTAAMLINPNQWNSAGFRVPLASSHSCF